MAVKTFDEAWTAAEANQWDRAPYGAQMKEVAQAMVNATAGVPVVASVTANSGPAAGGTDVTIAGSNLEGATAVTFGGAAATSVVVVNDDTITCKTPAHAAGAVTVAVTNAAGSGSKATAFTYS